MGEIIVRKDWTAADRKQADLKRSVHRPTNSTAVTRVLDMADLGKTVCLCEDHVRQFATPKVLSKYGYRQMIDYPHVLGNCDYCQVFTKCQMFMHLTVFAEVWRTKEQRRQDSEYATIVRG